MMMGIKWNQVDHPVCIDGACSDNDVDDVCEICLSSRSEGTSITLLDSVQKALCIWSNYLVQSPAT